MIKLVEIKPGEDYSTSAAIRITVFVEEQGIPIENEMDEHDAFAWHIILYTNNTPVGSGRIYIVDDTAKLGRVAVIKNERGKGYATMICNALIEVAKRENAKLVTLNSQSYVASLYDKMGFIRCGKEFLEEGIPHIRMDLDLGK
jgi:predicted GNAT family N-acyltransferase